MSSRHPSTVNRLCTTIMGGVLALSPLPEAAFGGNHDLGFVSYRQGQFEQAFPLLRASAEGGDSKAQYLLATMYRLGLGVSPDEYEGFFWCLRAAKQGMVDAQYQLGLMYLEGEGVTEDEEQALEWLGIAADRGHPQAIQVLQYIYTREYDFGC